MTSVKLYDTTLRDGMQGQGMSLSANEKVRVVHALDALGVHFIEAGFPASNPKEAELFELLAGEELRQASICAFGMTRRRGVEADRDEALRLLAGTFAPVVTLVGKTWSLHLEKVTKVSREENLAMIGESIAYLRGEGKRVMYDAEHFFDAWGDDREYSLECLRTAHEAGAEVLVLCDTNGAHLPAQIGAAVAEVHGGLPGAELGIHCHNDAECGVANALAAVDAGARQVQGTVNGYGERCGNSNLISILPALQLKMGYDVVPQENMRELSSVSHFVADLLNVPVDPDQHTSDGTRSRTRVGCTWPASRPTRVRSSTWTPRPWATAAPCCPRSSRARPRSSPARRRSGWHSATRTPAARSIP